MLYQAVGLYSWIRGTVLCLSSESPIHVQVFSSGEVRWPQLPCFKLNLVDHLVPTSPCHLISFADRGNGHMSGGSLGMPCYEGDLSIGGAKTCVSSSMLITTALYVPQDFYCTRV